jgi:hypothetical protein
MRCPLAFALALIALNLVASLDAEAPLAKPRDARCFVVMEEGASSEGNSLYLNKMGVEPALLRLFAPTRFETGTKGIELKTEGEFSYQAEGIELAARSKGLAVYAVNVTYQAAAMPEAKAEVVVEFKLSELAKGSGFVQPAEKAIALASAKAHMRSGLAWVVEMEMPSPQSFRAKVRLAP